VFGSNRKIDATYLAAQTVKCQSLYDYREQPSLDAIRTSFFLHAYYATLLKFDSSMAFLQDAIAFSKLLEARFQEQEDCRREELDTLVTLLVSIPGHENLFMNFQCLLDNYGISISSGHRLTRFVKRCRHNLGAVQFEVKVTLLTFQII
jgi:hypothetical protein